MNKPAGNNNKCNNIKTLLYNKRLSLYYIYYFYLILLNAFNSYYFSFVFYVKYVS